MRFFPQALLVIVGLVLNSSLLKAQQPDTGGSSGCKICVPEPKQNTHKVYACKIEEYCLPRCSLLSFLRRDSRCNDIPCGELRVRHRLVVKTVPDCQTIQCLPRELRPTPGCIPTRR
jgi:hypothetical protein